MIENINRELDLKCRLCKTLDEAVAFGETRTAHSYHILVKQKRKKMIICVVYHVPYTTCKFCAMDENNTELFIWL